MIISFADQATKDIFDGRRSKRAERTCPAKLWKIAARKLDMLNQAGDLIDLKAPPGNCLEMLKGDRSGQCSIRINEQYRICFIWTRKGPKNVEITDYH